MPLAGGRAFRHRSRSHLAALAKSIQEAAGRPFRFARSAGAGELAEALAPDGGAGGRGVGRAPEKRATARQEESQPFAGLVSSRPLEALAATPSRARRTHPREPGAAGATGAGAIDAGDRAAQPLGEREGEGGAGSGGLARAARNGEALPLHGGELLAGKERSLGRGVEPRSGLAGRGARSGRLARADREAFPRRNRCARPKPR